MQTAKRLVVVHRYTTWLMPTLTWLYNQVRHLPADVESHVVCEATANLDRFSVPHLHSLDALPRWRSLWQRGTRKLGLRRHLPLVVEVSRRVGAQILHSHFGNVAWSDIGAARRAGLAHVVTFYGADVNSLVTEDPRWYRRFRELFAHVDRVLCEGPHMGQCIEALGCPPAKIRIHHIGVELDRIPFSPRRRGEGEALRILIAGVFREKKGIPYAIEAVSRLRERRPDVPIELTLIGDAAREPESQREKERIEAALAKSRLAPRRLGLIPLSQLFDEAYRCHVFLSPSVSASNGDTEGGAPVSILELLASGMPVVSSRHCDIPHIVDDGVSALLADERDVEGLAGHLEWLIEHPEQWEPMVRAGRARIEREFSVVEQCARLAEIYRELAHR